MSAEQYELEAERSRLIEAVRSQGEQAALSFAREWSDVAWDALVDLARSGRHFTADDLIAEVGSPPSHGATGALFRQAARNELIHCVGVDTSRRVSRHGGLQRVWQGVGPRRDATPLRDIAPGYYELARRISEDES